MDKNDTDIRFSMLELDDAPAAALEWDNSPDTTPNAPITLETVEDLYKGAFKGHATLEDAMMEVPELVSPVEKVPLYTGDGLQVPGAYATIRTLPDGRKQALGTVGERYHVIQDSHAFDIMRPLVDQGILGTITAGVYKAKSWLYGEAGDFRADIVPGDTIKARFLVGNSHDGSIPWSFGFPGNRVVCQNTFHMALSSKLSKLLKVRHTASSDQIVQQVKTAIGIFGMEFVEAADKFRYLAQVKATEDTLRDYVGYVFRPSKWAEEDSEQEESSGGRVYAKVLENFEGGRGAEYGRGTLWGAYNAVTEYLTHDRPRNGTSSEQAFADLQWGNGELLARRALDGALEMAQRA